MKYFADRPEDVSHGVLFTMHIVLLSDQCIDPSICLECLPEKVSQRDSRAANALVRCFQPELQVLEVASDCPFLSRWIHIQQVGRITPAVVKVEDALADTPVSRHATARATSDNDSSSQSTRTELPADEKRSRPFRAASWNSSVTRPELSSHRRHTGLANKAREDAHSREGGRRRKPNPAMLSDDRENPLRAAPVSTPKSRSVASKWRATSMRVLSAPGWCLALDRLVPRAMQ